MGKRSKRVSRVAKRTKRPSKSKRSKVSRKSAKKTVKRKSKGPSPYNKFVKKMSPVLRKANPGMKQPSIMKLIAKEWNKAPHGSLTKI